MWQRPFFLIGDRILRSLAELGAEERAELLDALSEEAERMGLRRVRVADVSRGTIEVQGRKRNGERVYVTFSRQSRHCAVI